MSAPGQKLPYTGVVAYVRPESTPDEIRWTPDIAAKESEVEGKADIRRAWLER